MGLKRKRTAEAPNSWSWTEYDSSLLIRLVRQCQKLGSSGVHGEWKTFLKVLAAGQPVFAPQLSAEHRRC